MLASCDGSLRDDLHETAGRVAARHSVPCGPFKHLDAFDVVERKLSLGSSA